jgi:hypothetical protein
LNGRCAGGGYAGIRIVAGAAQVVHAFSPAIWVSVAGGGRLIA